MFSVLAPQGTIWYGAENVDEERVYSFVAVFPLELSRILEQLSFARSEQKPWLHLPTTRFLVIHSWYDLRKYVFLPVLSHLPFPNSLGLYLGY